MIDTLMLLQVALLNLNHEPDDAVASVFDLLCKATPVAVLKCQSHVATNKISGSCSFSAKANNSKMVLRHSPC